MARTETHWIRLGAGQQLAWEWQGLIADPAPAAGGELEGGETITLQQLGIRLAVVEAAAGEVLLRVETPPFVRAAALDPPACGESTLS